VAEPSKAERIAALDRRAWHEPCPKCGAKPAEGCFTTSGMRTAIHAARRRMAIYKPLPPGPRS
jgi:hypothetical protein